MAALIEKLMKQGETNVQATTALQADIHSIIDT